MKDCVRTTNLFILILSTDLTYKDIYLKIIVFSVYYNN